MQSELPFYESPEDAIRAAVQALGGTKSVGPTLWPDKGIEASSRLLHDCMNIDRKEKLEMTQTMLILTMAKEIGCHAPFQWLAAQMGYDIKPITKAEELDRLTTVVEQSTKTLSAALMALERIQSNGTVVQMGRQA